MWFFKMVNEKCSKDLIISYFFPEYVDTGGFVVAKRIIENGKKVDVIQNHIENVALDNSLNDLINEYVEDKIVLHAYDAEKWEWSVIKPFIKEGMVELNNQKSKKGVYKSIYSRAMPTPAHFLAFEYKTQNPDTKWTAEFSDPVLFDNYGKERNTKLKDEKYIKKVNSIISQDVNLKEMNLNSALDSNLTSIEFLCELLPFLFADKIIFTNENQKKLMINKFLLKNKGNFKNFKQFIDNKSLIKPQPILKKSAYESIQSKYKIDNNYINFAYFGLFYGNRNFEDVFYAFENISPFFKSKCKLHIFTSQTEFVKRATSDLKIKDNIIINKSRSFLDFLNLTTKFDVLIVTDANTEDYFEINPYLPSKLSDYIGSGSDIWGICELGSILDSNEIIKYKSRLGDYISSKVVVNKIIQEKLNCNENGEEFNNPNLTEVNTQEQNDILKSNLNEVINYLKKRNIGLTDDLNNVINLNHEKQFYINKLENDLKSSKVQLNDQQVMNLKSTEEIDKMVNSSSWKLTKPLRSIGQKIRK